MSRRSLPSSRKSPQRNENRLPHECTNLVCYVQSSNSLISLKGRHHGVSSSSTALRDFGKCTTLATRTGESLTGSSTTGVGEYGGCPVTAPFCLSAPTP